jgi:hypothetical protein
MTLLMPERAKRGPENFLQLLQDSGFEALPRPE